MVKGAFPPVSLSSMLKDDDSPAGSAKPIVRPWFARLFIRAGDTYRRLFAAWCGIVGPRAAYFVTGHLARLLYALLTPIRERAEAQCAAALGRHVAAERIPHIARQSFVHRVWNLTDLFLADRLLHPRTYERYGGRIPEPHLTRMLGAQRRGRATILLTAYYGPFDLLPVFMGFNGIRSGAVYRPHDNPVFDAYRRRIRSRGGCELVTVDKAAHRFSEILDGGGSVAIIADHHAERGGMAETFLGLPTKAIRSVGLLAWRYDADVVVAGIRRVDRSFHFQVIVNDVLYARDWRGKEDPVAFITDFYLRSLERLILSDPTQYLWAHPRWGREFAYRIAAEYDESARR